MISIQFVHISRMIRWNGRETPGLHNGYCHLYWFYVPAELELLRVALVFRKVVLLCHVSQPELKTISMRHSRSHLVHSVFQMTTWKCSRMFCGPRGIQAGPKY